MTDFEEVNAADVTLWYADLPQWSGLDLPTITSITPGQPPLLVLDDQQAVLLADLPAPALVPRTSQGVAVLLTNWCAADSQAYLVPDSLVPAPRLMADQRRGHSDPPVLVGVELTPDAIMCQPAQGRHRVIVPRPFWIQPGYPVPFQAGDYVRISLYPGELNAQVQAFPREGTHWRVYPDTPEGQAVLAALKFQFP